MSKAHNPQKHQTAQGNAERQRTNPCLVVHGHKVEIRIISNGCAAKRAEVQNRKTLGGGYELHQTIVHIQTQTRRNRCAIVHCLNGPERKPAAKKITHRYQMDKDRENEREGKA